MPYDNLNGINRISIPPNVTTPQRSTQTKGPSFSDVLQQEQGIKVSAHAQTRLRSRNIELDKAQWQRIEDGVRKAEAKGSKESLVLMDDVALVVSVRNKTVITAVDKQSLKEHVFTNIDSAVIV